MFAGMVGAIGGMLYASYVEGVIAFGYNRLNWTFLPFVMIIVGGMANNKGVLLGTLIFVVIRKLVVYYNDAFDGYLPFDIIWLDYLLLGGIMLVVLLFKPRGLIPEKPQ
jgi:branched-chain amino acid transport system permease protein